MSTLYNDRRAWKGDRPLPVSAAMWLENGMQTDITPRIRTAAEEIGFGSRRARLLKAMNHVMRNFSYDNWMNENQFETVAGDLYERKNLGGCSDFALVFLPLLRAVGIPSRLVATTNVKWIAEYKKNPYKVPNGHSFIEVYLEDRWHLFDPAYRWLYTNYDPTNPNYPREEYFLNRGKDFWDMNIHSMQDAIDQMIEGAKAYKGPYVKPPYQALKFNPDEFKEKKEWRVDEKSDS